MVDRFRARVSASGLIPPGSRVLVGYSGGADSTCLLDLLAQCGVDVVAAYLHHGLRAEADKELGLCAAFAESIGAPFVSGKADVARIAADIGIGLEEAGRKARYGFFEQAARQTDCTLIATAHTRTDLAETVVLNISRGAGLKGASGIPEKRGAIIRPLLGFSREETRTYCAERGLWTCDDPANEDVNFSRVRVRMRVMPELEIINPGSEAAIARFASLAAEEDRFLDGAAAASLERAEIPLNGELAFLTQDCEIAFATDALGHLPAVLFRRAIRLASEAVGAPLEFDHVATIESGISSGTPGSITAEGGRVAIEWNSERILVRNLSPTAPFRYPLTVPGETESEEFGWALTAFHAEAHPDEQRREGMKAILNPANIKGALYFRTFENGDTMAPFGFDGARKVADLMSEYGLTLAARRRAPIICDMVGPIWIPGVCLSNRVKLTEATAQALHIHFGPIDKSLQT